jgi:hypothetical protein
LFQQKIFHLERDERQEGFGTLNKANRDKGKEFYLNFFNQRIFGKITTYRVIKRGDNNLSLNRVKGLGRKGPEMVRD